MNEFPDAADYVMDCNHWFDPRKEAAQALRQKTETAGLSYSYEVFLAYEAMMFAADAMERAGSADRAKITEAMASSTWSDHFMPYGPTKMVNGQNEGAQAMVMQVLDKEIEVVAPKAFATKAPVFPRPA